ncbi:MAG: ribosomal protein methyltransferase, partial [Bacteroidota bacterium]|nr:ribosomal protein methyltransferase [Bacteroidota bacterium]
DMVITQILKDNEFQHIRFSSQLIKDRNWNEEWEKNFEPVVVAGKVAIRAPFHPQFNTEFEIVIEPKMSFGTGHHATTASVIELMLGEDFSNKSVLDFGSGTGVLAILAEKLKASNITAIDNEEWAYNNCVENIERNGCVHIRAVRGDESYLFDQKFDIILANINRNVILQNISKWKLLLNETGLLIASGILVSDEHDIIEAAAKTGLVVKNKLNNNGWLAIAFQHLKN